MALRHSLGSDMRRYRLTLSEARDASWRSIRYIRPQQKLKEASISIILFLSSSLLYHLGITMAMSN